jgi:hypothetical protein
VNDKRADGQARRRADRPTRAPPAPRRPGGRGPLTGRRRAAPTPQRPGVAVDAHREWYLPRREPCPVTRVDGRTRPRGGGARGPAATQPASTSTTSSTERPDLDRGVRSTDSTDSTVRSELLDNDMLERLERLKTFVDELRNLYEDLYIACALVYEVTKWTICSQMYGLMNSRSHLVRASWHENKARCTVVSTDYSIEGWSCTIKDRCQNHNWVYHRWFDVPRLTVGSKL